MKTCQYTILEQVITLLLNFQKLIICILTIYFFKECTSKVLILNIRDWLIVMAVFMPYSIQKVMLIIANLL